MLIMMGIYSFIHSGTQSATVSIAYGINKENNELKMKELYISDISGDTIP